MLSVAALQQMWERAWPIISLLLACSIFSIAIILERWVTIGRADFNRDALMTKLRKMIVERHREQALAHCENVRAPVGRVLSGILEYALSVPTAKRENLERLSDRLIRVQNVELARYLTGLGTIGSVAPFVGLFGTVIGIIEAFKAISENSGGGPGVVANGIAEALITTALGLFVAIPAVVAYNLLSRRAERVSENMGLCADEVIDLLGNP